MRLLAVTRNGSVMIAPPQRPIHADPADSVDPVPGHAVFTRGDPSGKQGADDPARSVHHGEVHRLGRRRGGEPEAQVGPILQRIRQGTQEPGRAGDGLIRHGARIESGPEEYTYKPGYYAVFFYDPDGIKLEILNIPELAA